MFSSVQTSKTSEATILRVIKNVIVSNTIANRSFFTPSNGTFRINNLSWTDGGEYELVIFDSDGKISEQRTLQLTIQGKSLFREFSGINRHRSYSIVELHIYFMFYTYLCMYVWAALY